MGALLRQGPALASDEAGEVANLLPLLRGKVADLVEAGQVCLLDGDLVLLLGDVAGQDQELAHRKAHGDRQFPQSGGPGDDASDEEGAQGAVGDASLPGQPELVGVMVVEPVLEELGQGMGLCHERDSIVQQDVDRWALMYCKIVTSETEHLFLLSRQSMVMVVHGQVRCPRCGSRGARELNRLPEEGHAVLMCVFCKHTWCEAGRRDAQSSAGEVAQPG